MSEIVEEEKICENEAKAREIEALLENENLNSSMTKYQANYKSVY